MEVGCEGARRARRRELRLRVLEALGESARRGGVPLGARIQVPSLLRAPDVHDAGAEGDAERHAGVWEPARAAQNHLHGGGPAAPRDGVLEPRSGGARERPQLRPRSTEIAHALLTPLLRLGKLALGLLVLLHRSVVLFRVASVRPHLRRVFLGAIARPPRCPRLLRLRHARLALAREAVQARSEVAENVGVDDSHTPLLLP
mmetsp:Transcript_26933/g.88382  ORF Transcript_26933/g.88382 Transcript_26933/m.88382 type:complete len:202 (+) Transcript_26933:1220-1825(+)